MINIEEIQKQFEAETAGGFNIEETKNKFLSRKNGIITKAFEEFIKLDVDSKKKLGPELNALKKLIEDKLLGSTSEKILHNIDLTLPPLEKQFGHLHPLTQTQHELEEIFRSLGFEVAVGQEIESDWYNFTALNFPPDHPARDMQDTFFVKSDSKDKLVMRTHTSPMQVKFMQSHTPPFSMVVPGMVYRNEATDATHEHTFAQMEGLVVGKDINFANMIWVLDFALKRFFGNSVKTKVLPTYFPFVEPGAEVAISSPNFKNGKWIELLGCGMVHQNVFEAAGYKKNEYQGFAFGFGMTRFALMKYGIPDIRLFSENNLEFLEQY